jgi:hypothetical protein
MRSLSAANSTFKSAALLLAWASAALAQEILAFGKDTVIDRFVARGDSVCLYNVSQDTAKVDSILAFPDSSILQRYFMVFFLPRPERPSLYEIRYDVPIDMPYTQTQDTLRLPAGDSVWLCDFGLVNPFFKRLGEAALDSGQTAATLVFCSGTDRDTLVVVGVWDNVRVRGPRLDGVSAGQALLPRRWHDLSGRLQSSGAGSASAGAYLGILPGGRAYRVVRTEPRTRTMHNFPLHCTRPAGSADGDQ